MKNLFYLIMIILFCLNVKAQNQSVIIYTMNGCGRCEYAKKFMNENNIKYTEYNTSDNDENITKMYEEVNKTDNAKNFNLMPVIIYNSNIDYNMENMQVYMINLKANVGSKIKHNPNNHTKKVINKQNTGLTDEETKLYNLIMEYRKEKGLPSIPLSKSLTFVAQTHVKDLQNNKPDQGECNAHSWSSKGKWTSCCYTPDHKNAECMWNKPRELTSYTGNGFEIACGSSDSRYSSFVMTAEYALQSWKKSQGHNTVIVNMGIWKDYSWNAIGIGIYKGFAVVWFGVEEDK